MEVQRQPPNVPDLITALRPLLRDGLPVDSALDNVRLLGLRGVVARSVDPDDRLARVKALDDLLRRLLAYYPNDVLGEAARVLFGVTPGTRGTTLTARREQAARETEYDPDHFRRRIEPKILKQLAWQLHQDSLNYLPRSRNAPPPLAISGDTPHIAIGDVAERDKAEHEEMLSRLWSCVYALRAEILRVEQLKTWPYDETEPQLSQQKLDEALAAREGAIEDVKLAVRQYIDTYGERIAHGESEFNAQALLRLAGWTGS